VPEKRRRRPGGQFRTIRVLAEYGTPEQKRKYLKRLLAGESVISVGMTEPEAGSAVTDLQTRATPEGDGYRVNGSKGVHHSTGRTRK